MLKTAMRYSHQLIQDVLTDGGVAVDATMGNGNDTLFLSQCVGEEGQVYAFDIQKLALQNTAKRLEEASCSNVTLIHSGHENIAQYVPKDIKIDAAIFNLGYLPKSDKQIITTAPTTIQALEFLLTHLKEKGRIVLVLYYGHDGGEEEKNAVIDFAASLSQDNYQVLTYQFINQRNSPPICLCIEKKAIAH